MQMAPKGQRIHSHFVSDKTLSGFRVCFLLLTTYFFAWQVAVQDPVISYWHFLTNWGFTVLMLYSWSCCFMSFGRPSLYYNEVHRALFATAVPVAWMVTIGFWTLLSDLVFQPYKHWNGQGESLASKQFHTIYAHLMNLVLALISLFLGKTVVGWRHVVFPIFFVVAYMTTVVISFCSFGSDWPYGFLSVLGNTCSTLKPLYLVLLLVATIIAIAAFFWITLLMIALRDRNKEVGIRDEIDRDDGDDGNIDSIELTRIRVKHQRSSTDLEDISVIDEEVSVARPPAAV